MEQGLFQVDLAKGLGVDEMKIVNWEAGKTKPTKPNVAKLVALFPDLGAYLFFL